MRSHDNQTAPVEHMREVRETRRRSSVRADLDTTTPAEVSQIKGRVWRRIMLDMALAELVNQIPDNISKVEQVGVYAIPIPVLRHVVECYEEWRR